MHVEIKKISRDTDGRLLIIDATIKESDVVLMNIYAPNTDSPEYLANAFEMLGSHKHADRIIAGDFNLVMDEKLDVVNRKGNNKKSQKVIKTVVNDSMLVDPRHERNPDLFQFTWYKKRPQEIFARLDYIFINYALMGEVKNVANIPSFKSDHNAVMIELSCNKQNPRGPGFWKLNDSILNDLECVKKLNEKLENCKQKAKDNDPCMRWELLKECSVKTCKELCKERSRQINDTVKNLQNQAHNAQEKIDTASNMEEKCAAEMELNECKGNLERYLEYKAEGARIRSRAMWYERGERSTKYFLGLEKVKYSNKTLNILRCEDGTITRNEKKILNEQTKFYKCLFSKNPEIKFIIEDNFEHATHSSNENKCIDADFTFEEFTAALKSMAKGKVPGNDGLTTSFYIVFWGIIGKTLWEAILQLHKNGMMYRSGRRGVISLIPKKHKNALDISQWRPLMLLNTCHKIVS